MICGDDVDTPSLNQVLSPTGYPFTKFWFALLEDHLDRSRKQLFSFGSNSLEVCVTMAMIRLWMLVDYVLDRRDDKTPVCSALRVPKMTKDCGWHHLRDFALHGRSL
jgi:hypothetical protein